MASSQQVSAGKHELSVHFAPKEKFLKPDYFTGDVTLYVDGAKAGELKDIKMAAQYSAMTGYGVQVGRNAGTPVSHAYEAPFQFTGQLDKVIIEVAEAKN